MENNSWIMLEEQAQLDYIFGSEGNALIFKHSTRCHISSLALNRFNKEWRFDHDSCSCYLLDLLSYRHLSDEITRRLGIVHQSPQIILFRQGKVIHAASHHEIDATEIQSKLL